jgi:hypothetical protein
MRRHVSYAMIIGTRGYSSPLDRIDAPLNVMAEMAHVGLLQIPLSLGAMLRSTCPASTPDRGWFTLWAGTVSSTKP